MGFVVCLCLFGNWLCVDVIVFGQCIVGIQLFNWVIVLYVSSYQFVCYGLIYRLFNIGQQMCYICIGLWYFGCVGVEQVIQVGLYVVLQLVEFVVFVEEIFVGYDVLLQDCCIVLVIYKYVVFFGIQCCCLISCQSFVSDFWFLFKFQDNGGIVVVEIYCKCVVKCRQCSVFVVGGILYECVFVFCCFQFVGQIFG